MKNAKQLGIWMDHSNAFLMELSDGAIIENIIASGFSYNDKESSLKRNEHLMHVKEQHDQSDYYKKISGAIKDYDEVLLFGPTDAKNELLNLLNSNHLNESIKIEIKDSDTMTANQMHEFVKEYFK
ncbi:MAG: hypothetical protein ABIJ97_12610 [Bacteroidota bacterium]